MKAIASIAAVALMALSVNASQALASDEEEGGACTAAAETEWKPSEEARTAAVALGYDVRRVKTEDGCYEVYAIDKDGKRVEVFMDPISLKVVRVKEQS